MHWVIFFHVTISLFGLQFCHDLYEGTIQKILSEVNTSLTHRPTENSVPVFMRDLYTLLREENHVHSSYSRDALYRHIPAIKSFHAISQGGMGRQFAFDIQDTFDTGDLFSAELMVNGSVSRISATFENENLMMTTATLSDRYDVFNVTDIVIRKKLNNDTRVTFTFSASLSERDAYLVVYEHISAERILHSRRKRDADLGSNLYLFLTSGNSESGYPNIRSPDPDNGCHRKNWIVDFMELSWFWLVTPTIVNVGICSRDCNLFSTNVNTTNYSFMRDVYLSQHGATNNVFGAVCTPVEFYDLQILYLTSNNDFVVKVLPEMKVKTCACR